MKACVQLQTGMEKYSMESQDSQRVVVLLMMMVFSLTSIYFGFVVDSALVDLFCKYLLFLPAVIIISPVSYLSVPLMGPNTCYKDLRSQLF
jgi:putative Mn2+ efflux pump MntP